ncbi:MAG: MFS transporter [Verrucomicrobia bacterium]|nr:MFS transporter [Verrucomicrobiota bacterium]
MVASSLGTIFEWYDFYLYGSLAVFFGGLFFPPGNPVAANLASLATFGAGFGVRPFGAIVFGRIGDIVGRKYTFLITILVMGLSTALVGVLPTYKDIGIWAPVLLVTLRLAQGLALGGEYGGAATYVAEHAPNTKRGLFTSWIQTTATLGFFLSLAIILSCRLGFGDEVFKAWAWRIPFLVSVILLAISVYIRLRLRESPIFAELKSAGKASKTPLRDSFFKLPNARYVWLALLGATAGQGVVWYTGQFQALYFIQNILKLDFQNTYLLIGISLLVGTPFFLFFGWLSDRIGRKVIILAGCLLAAVTYIPLFQALTGYINPALKAASEKAPVVLYTSEFKGQSQALVTVTDAFQQYHPPADQVPSYKARQFLIKRGVPFEVRDAKPDAPLTLAVGDQQQTGFDDKAYESAVSQAGYPKAADPSKINWVGAEVILIWMVIYVTMVYGPIAAFLVEMFPTQIRYTSMSFPYHIGNGWFGGFLPLIVAAITAATGNFFAGLWYPIGVALMTVIVGTLFLRETKNRDLRGYHTDGL